MAQDVRLDQRTINNWNPLRFQFMLTNPEAMQTLEKTFKWYDSYRNKYAAENGLPSYQRFDRHVDALKRMYQQAKPDGLDLGERKELLAGAYNVDKDLTKLMQRADEDRLTKKLATDKPINETADGAKKPEHFGADGKTFDGKYQAVDSKKGALDEVAAGRATIGLGAKGPEVKEAQELMLKHGAKFEKRGADGKTEKDYGADGFMGPVTQQELQKLQKGWGLEETGTVDDKTLERLRADPNDADPKKADPKKTEPKLPELIEV